VMVPESGLPCRSERGLIQRAVEVGGPGFSRCWRDCQQGTLKRLSRGRTDQGCQTRLFLHAELPADKRA
jgi:hypothetical protein